MSPSDFLPALSIVLTVCVLIGGILAMRSSYFKSTGELQKSTIDALKTRVETLESQVEGDEKEITRLRQILNTVRHALKRRGLHIEIEGDFVTLIDSDGQSRSTPIPPAPKIPRPLKPMNDDEIDAS